MKIAPLAWRVLLTLAEESSGALQPQSHLLRTESDTLHNSPAYRTVAVERLGADTGSGQRDARRDTSFAAHLRVDAASRRMKRLLRKLGVQDPQPSGPVSPGRAIGEPEDDGDTTPYLEQQQDDYLLTLALAQSAEEESERQQYLASVVSRASSVGFSGSTRAEAAAFKLWSQGRCAPL